MFPCAAARHVKCSKIRRAVKCLFTYRRGQERRAGAEPAEIALDQLNDERIRLHVIHQRKVVWHGARKQRHAEVLGQIGMQRIAERIAEHQKQSKIYLGTNTKMYKAIAQTVEFLSSLRDRTADISREELERARQTVTPEQIHLGAQNMGWEQEGQFSGEISPVMLKEVGMELVMIGHSKRRHVLGETDEAEGAGTLGRGTADTDQNRSARRARRGRGEGLDRV